jgi:hypothetical protein
MEAFSTAFTIDQLLTSAPLLGDCKTLGKSQSTGLGKRQRQEKYWRCLILALSRTFASTGVREAQHHLCGIRDVGGPEIRVFMTWSLHNSADLNGFAPSSSARFGVSPAVAYSKAGGQVDPQIPGGFQQHAGAWLSARAIVNIVMETTHQRVDGQSRTQGGVDRFDCLLRHAPPSDIGLIGHDHDDQTSRTEIIQSLADTRQDLELTD